MINIKEDKEYKHLNFKKEIKKLVGDEYEVLSEYISSTSNTKFRHKKCNLILYIKPIDFLNGKRCATCNKSIDKSKLIIKRICEQCNSEFLLSKDEVLNSSINICYCSKQCKDKMKELECKKCGRKFLSRYYKAFCSDNCKKDICKVCGKIYIKKNSESYCSEDCKKKLYEHICKTCGEKFYHKSNKRFCSPECRTAYSSVKNEVSVCKNCKVIINYKGTKIDFCSSNCRIEYYSKNNIVNKNKSKIDIQKLKDVISYKINILISIRNKAINNFERVIDYRLISGFNELLKEKVKNRDNNKCFICECNTNLDVHHIIPQRLGGEHKEINLITLCRKCHRYIETGNEEYALNKCLENAKKYYGIINFSSKSFEKLPIKLQLLNVEEDLSRLYNKLEEIELDDSLELREKLSDIIDELTNCINEVK